MFRTIWCIIFSFLWTAPLFAQSVDTAWDRRYNGPGNKDDKPGAMTVDSTGSVYVTGQSYGDGTDYDYATVKYSPSGNQLWVQRYNGPGDTIDYAFGIAVDGEGNAYVTGWSYDSLTLEDYASIKYDSSGNELWVRRYDGPGNYFDRANAIAMYGSGNIYVTGWSWDYGTFGDYATIRYDASGNTLWVKRYNGPGNTEDDARAITVDGSGNVYVTGHSYASGTLDDYASIKYDPSGNQLWARTYNGPANGYDWAVDITVDHSGNAYVTGQSYGNGTFLDYTTIKYGPSGNQLWVQRYNGPGNYYDQAYAIAVDNWGNVYVTGTSSQNSSYPWNYDYVTIKYNSSGNELWVRRYNSPGDSDDRAFAIAVDSWGNIYVTGESYDNATAYDYATIKYDSSGNELWVRRYNGSDNSSDTPWAIEVDSSGRVYVTGESYGSATQLDYATIKYVQFLRGDANEDDSVDIVDAIYVVNYILKSGSAPVPIPQVGDVNCDNKVDIIDVVYLVNYLFKSGTAPCE